MPSEEVTLLLRPWSNLLAFHASVFLVYPLKVRLGGMHALSGSNKFRDVLALSHLCDFLLIYPD